MKRVEGIEPSSLAWKAIALPLSYTRVGFTRVCYRSLRDSEPGTLGRDMLRSTKQAREAGTVARHGSQTR